MGKKRIPKCDCQGRMQEVKVDKDVCSLCGYYVTWVAKCKDKKPRKSLYGYEEFSVGIKGFKVFNRDGGSI